MSKRLATVILLLLAVLSMSGADVCATNEVRILPTTLRVGQSMPVDIQVTNDRPAYALTTGLLFHSINGGIVHLDSGQFVGRLADPSVLDYRIIRNEGPDTTSQDTVRIVALRMFSRNMLPVGSDVSIRLYVTAEAIGSVQLDSTWLPPSSGFQFLLAGDTAWQSFLMTPNFVSPEIPIEQSVLPPTIAIDGSIPIGVQGSSMQFDAHVTDPGNYPVTVTLTDVHGVDQVQQTPQSLPAITGTDPAHISWTPGGGDVGVWQATIHACNSEGMCTDRQIVLQVVSDQTYALSFDQTESDGFAIANDMTSGDFDNDGRPDIVASGDGWNGTPYLGVYRVGLNGVASAVYDDDIHCLKEGLQSGYIDGDSLLDILGSRLDPTDPAVELYRGNGDLDFEPSEVAAGLDVGFAGCLGDFNGDAVPDYALANKGDGVQILVGNRSQGVSYSVLSTFDAGDTVLSLRAGDFNNDGYDDLAVGTITSTMIFINDGTGNFSLRASYPQSYGSSDIQVTGDGADIDDNGTYDLCVSAPSVGGTYSDIEIYLGNGDGTFDTSTVAVVKGQAKASKLVDMNGDGSLDVVYLNTSQRYVGILYGNSTGAFANETRYTIDKPSPTFLDCFDYDLDGDVDIVVSAQIYNTFSSLFVLSNQLNPQDFHRVSFNVAACDNAALSVTSAKGGKLSRITNSMPSGRFYMRDIDGNSVRDDYAVINAASSGQYTLQVKARAANKSAGPFSLTYTLDGTRFRLADHSTMPFGGVNFGVYPAEVSPVLPTSGVFIHNPRPSFAWPDLGPVRFQLASDLTFSQPIVNMTVNNPYLTLTESLPSSDTALYFWRVIPNNDPSDNIVYAFNLISSQYAGGCGDFNGDGTGPDLADLVAMIDYMFGGNVNAYNPALGDADSNGMVDISDLVGMVDFLYSNAPRPGC